MESSPSNAVESNTKLDYEQLILNSRKRTFDLFQQSQNEYKPFEDTRTTKMKVNVRMHDDYADMVQKKPQPLMVEAARGNGKELVVSNFSSASSSIQLESKVNKSTFTLSNESKVSFRLLFLISLSCNKIQNNANRPHVEISDIIDEPNITKEVISKQLEQQKIDEEQIQNNNQIVEYKNAIGNATSYFGSKALAIKNPYLMEVSQTKHSVFNSRQKNKNTQTTKKPQWHAPWKLMRVISGHMGWVRSISVDVSNEWFCTGAGTITRSTCTSASFFLKLIIFCKKKYFFF